MNKWQEQIAVTKWLELKSSAEHYERLQANAEAATHSDAAGWAITWRSLAKEKRRQMEMALATLPTREDILKEAA